MIQGDPDCEMIENEIDWARLVKFILLELSAKKPIPLNEKYLTKKGFDLKKRPISLTLQMLHNFINVSTEEPKLCHVDKDKDKEEDKDKSKSSKTRHLSFVFLTDKEFEELKGGLGEKQTQDLIERLNDYIGSTGKKYKSHYHTIKNWARRDIQSTPQVKQPQEDYDKVICADLSKIATKDMIKKVMDKVPNQLWWKIDRFLQKRYPAGGGSFEIAQREKMAELRDNQDKVRGLVNGIGK